MIKIVDYRCPECGEIVTDAFEEENICPICGAKMNRLYGFQKYKEIPMGYYDNFDDKPVFIRDRSDFKRELKQRGLDVYTSEYKNAKYKNVHSWSKKK